MKLVHLTTAAVLACAVACGGGDGSEAEPAGGESTNGLPPPAETTGAHLDAPAPGTSDDATATPGSAGDPSAPSSNGGPAAAGDPGDPVDPAAPPTPGKPLYLPPECGADCVASDVPGVIARASKKYGLPRWFYYAVIRRESTFDRCKTQPEAAPNQDWGRGLTQVTFPWYAGVPFPQHVAGADNANASWRSNMGLDGAFGAWVDMKDVSAIPSTPATEADCRKNPKANDAYDPKTNIDRFSTGFAAPAYHLYHVPGTDPAETLRKIAYYWHYGLWGPPSGNYPNDPRPYLTCATCYDTYVKQYRAPVESDDGAWTGPTCKPPYGDSGC